MFSAKSVGWISAAHPPYVSLIGRGAWQSFIVRNEPAFYCVPAKSWEALMDKLEDTELNAIADARRNQPEIAVKLDEL